MKPYVFLGPSLPRAEAARLLDATYLPPVQQGDILRLLGHGPTVIGIVDGYFEMVPAVWHKEILFALESGVRVFGAASMGAIRAAELRPFGMVGVGTVYEWYRDGLIDRDDEVALVHAPPELGYLPLSAALVDIRDACDAAVRAQIVPRVLADRLVATASAMPFPERDYDAVARRAALEGDAAIVERWLGFCTSRGQALKARDTIALLHVLAQEIRDPRRSAPRQRVERTLFFERLRTEVRRAQLEAAPDARRTTNLGMQLTGMEPQTAMLLRVLAREEAQRNGWTLGTDEVSEHASRFCARLGLSDTEQRARWMRERSISDVDFWRFVNDALLLDKLERLYATEVERELVDHLRLLDGQTR